jgi:transcriptional regulator with XRE-family HTH domain
MALEDLGIDMSSFGRAVASARKKRGWSQKELAAKIIKEDGEAITPQYLNDIEHDRRSPTSDHLVGEFARVLRIGASGLFAVLGMLPIAERKQVKLSTPQKIDEAFVAFRRKLSSG